MEFNSFLAVSFNSSYLLNLCIAVRFPVNFHNMNLRFFEGSTAEVRCAADSTVFFKFVGMMRVAQVSFWELE